MGLLGQCRVDSTVNSNYHNVVILPPFSGSIHLSERYPNLGYKLRLIYIDEVNYVRCTVADVLII